MRKVVLTLAIVLVGVLVSAVTAPVARLAAQNTSCFFSQGGAAFTVGSGCVFNVASGGAFKVNGTTVNLARGVVAVTAADSGIETVVTGLATAVSCSATLATDPTTTAESATCSVGDQAGSPAAGSIFVKGWKTLGGTPVASSTTSVSVNWLASGS